MNMSLVQGPQRDSVIISVWFCALVRLAYPTFGYTYIRNRYGGGCGVSIIMSITYCELCSVLISHYATSWIATIASIEIHII